jgi:hypothetical protein
LSPPYKYPPWFELISHPFHHIFTPWYDATTRTGLTALQKCTAALHQLAYVMVVDIIDEYLKLGKTTDLECLEYVREHKLYALTVAQLSSRLARPIYTGGHPTSYNHH